MKGYSASKDNRPRIFATVVILSFALSSLVGQYIESLGSTSLIIMVFAQLVGFGFIASLILKVFNKMLLLAAGIPYLDGKYTGTLISSFDDVKQIPVELSIRQKFFSIEIVLETSTSTSSNNATFIDNSLDQNIGLQYTYSNLPHQYGVLNQHAGTCNLTFNHDSIHGVYYTDPNRQNSGTISVKRTK